MEMFDLSERMWERSKQREEEEEEPVNFAGVWFPTLCSRSDLLYYAF